MSFLSTAPDDFMEYLMQNHTRYAPIIEFLDNVTQSLSELSWAESEMIGAEISRADNSDYCTGVRNGMIKALNADESAMKSERFEPVLTFVRKLNQGAGTVNKSDVQAVLDAGWSEQTVDDIVGLVAAMKVYTILDNGLGFKGMPQATLDEMGKVTVQYQGYLPTFRYFVDSTSETTDKHDATQ